MNLECPNSDQVSVALSSLAKGRQGLSAAYGASLAEAAEVCFFDGNHTQPASLKIDGLSEFTAEIDWQKPDQAALVTWNDEEFTTEQAAYGIASLLVEKYGLEVVKRSRKGTGFDFWLGKIGQPTPLLFQGLARLEVSGIRSGDAYKIAQRTKNKHEQTKKSDSLSIPAVIAIVEFSNPTAQITER